MLVNREKFSCFESRTFPLFYFRLKFKTFIDKAFTETNIRYKILEEHQLPEDFTVPHNFPEFNYLKVVFIKIMH